MFGSAILEVVIGIIFIFLLVSIICSSVREVIEAWFKTRAAYLEYGIRELLHDKQAEGLAESFFNHPLINSLFAEGYQPGRSLKRPSILASGANLPSYIPAKNFARALMDIAARGPLTDAVSSDPDAPAITLHSIRMNILNIRSKQVQRVLLTAIDGAEGDLNKLQKNLEEWYDSAMDRVSGWYRRSTQWILFWIGLFIAVSMNVNTITIADYLYRNDAARSALVAKAETASADTNFLRQNYQEARQGLDSLHLPIGWTSGWGAPRTDDSPASKGVWNNLFGPILGWLLTALAATMGAPFWFDILNKSTVIRSTVKPHEKSPEESSEDRQPTKKQRTEIVVQKEPATGTGIAPPVKNLPPQELEEVPTHRDEESNVDGCDVEMEKITTDEELPAAEGGVQ